MYLINLLIVFIFGSIFGLSELLNRYTESKYVFKLWQAYTYVLLNGSISIIAFLLIKYLKEQELFDIETIEINNILIAGFGGMMILRSSIFSIKHKGEKVEIGFGAIAQIFLDVVERNMKNRAASIRLEEIDTLMVDINFDKAKDELSTLCICYIDNFSKEDNERLNKELETLSSLDITNTNKSLQLGRYISMYCDTKVLKKAIEKLGDNIKNSESDENLDEWIEKL